MRKHILSDGTTLYVKVARTMAGTEFTEVPSRKRAVGGHILWIDGPLYYVGRGGTLTSIVHPSYAYASDAKNAAALALAFYADSAEATIAHAAEWNIPVDDCY